MKHLSDLIADMLGTGEYESICETVLPPLCERCNEENDIIELGHCQDCITAIDRGYEISSKLGRLSNGAERDRGNVLHVRLLDEDHRAEYTALCGTAPGKRSGGWIDHDTPKATCERCANNLNRMGG